MRITGLVLLLLTAGMFLTGCGGAGKAVNARLYILDVKGPVKLSKQPVDGVLKIGNFTIAGPFDSRSMVLLTDDGTVEIDSYNKFVVEPAILFTQQSRSWFENKGTFKAVFPNHSRYMPDYMLEGNITKLFGDFRDGRADAVITAEFFLLQKYNGRFEPTFSKGYTASEALKDNTASELTKAYGRLWSKILEKLNNDIEAAINNENQSSTNR